MISEYVKYGFALALFTYLLFTSPMEERGYSVVVLPDTQKYSRSYPEIFVNQTRWIAQNKDDVGVEFVIHLGDLVDDAKSVKQWRVANDSMSVLEGVVAYSVLAGNHDLGSGYYDVFFPVSRYAEAPSFGGNYSGYVNNYHLFSAGGVDYLVLSLGFCPKEDAIEWGNKVLKKYGGRKAIIATHAYLNTEGERTTHVCGDTGYIWEKLVVPNPNVFLVLSGHVHGHAIRCDRVDGRAVYQILSDFQSEPLGGGGYLKVIRFNAFGKPVGMYSYSPYSDETRDVVSFSCPISVGG